MRPFLLRHAMVYCITEKKNKYGKDLLCLGKPKREKRSMRAAARAA